MSQTTSGIVDRNSTPHRNPKCKVVTLRRTLQLDDTLLRCTWGLEGEGWAEKEWPDGCEVEVLSEFRYVICRMD